MTAPLVVLGDVLLDVDVIGRSERMSPEAPVPVLEDCCERRRPGGAALAALLAARGSSRPVVLIAPFGADDAATELRALLSQEVTVLALPWTGSTAVKTRLRAGDHAVARIDRGGEPGVVTSVPQDLGETLARAAAILVSDYGRGVTSVPEIRRLLAAAAGRIPLVWDPHPRGRRPVADTTIVTPNEPELRGFVPSATTGTLAELCTAAETLGRDWQVGGVCVTRGRQGAVLSQGEATPLVVAGSAVSARDTCGAGDSFAAAAVAALADGALISEAVMMAVTAAGRFVESGAAAGIGAIRDEAVCDEAVCDEADSDDEDLAPWSQVRRAGGVIVATGGCFDLLHAGHVSTLEAARALGDYLVVCVNSDDSVRRLKGCGRPLQPAADRARLLAALHCVDAVVVFDEGTPIEALRRIQPAIWAKGGDYSGISLPEAEVLGEWGGVAVTVPYLQGRSTTALVGLAAPKTDAIAAGTQ
ncbi:MAG: D-beta-D-heptose 7-phosphate kinase / D-beta-D-heptose 1-phosphate adenosyltransferase [Pseudonocardiales bacterium]|nr:D-beta-D-heptose 7-phosphate kinase / D-beta-D-heptose 1-phosphate adenosyltransferase [Pseudonocardiales bacterium]